MPQTDSRPLHAAPARRLRLAAFALLTAAICFSAAAPALAQGTFGALPDPITSRDLDRYAERLGISDQQMQAISRHHREYLEQFRELRDGDVQDFLDAMRLFRREFDLSQRREVEQMVRRLSRIMNRIRAVDEQFFDQMQALLTEQQAAELPRLRLARERQRYGSEVTRAMDFLNRGVRVDLTEFLDAIDIDEETLQRIDPILADYERRLTSAARSLFEATTDMLLDALKRLEQMGFTEGRISEPAVALRLFTAFQEIWDEVTEDLFKEAQDIAALHRRTFRLLTELMPEEPARALRRAYYQRAYPEAASIGRSAERQFSAALDLPDLPENLRSGIRAVAESHRSAQGRLAEQMIDLLTERRRQPSLRDIARRGQDDWQERIDDLRSRAEAADESAISSLHAMLGPDLAEIVQSSGRQRDGRRWGPRFGGRAVVQRDADEGDDRASRSEPRLPSRISERDRRAIADRLGLDQTERSILATIHADYVEQYRNVQQEQMGSVRDAVRGIFAGDHDRDDAESAVDAAFSAYTAGFEATAALDEAFFGDLASIIGGEHASAVDQIRLERERERLVSLARQRRGGGGGGGGRRGGGFVMSVGREAPVDLSRVTLSLPLDGSTSAAAADHLGEYQQKAAELFRERYEAELEVRRAMLRMAADAAGSDRRPGRGVRRAMDTAARDLRQAEAAITQLNHSTMESLASVLPDDAADRLRREYYRQAFPEVFADPSGADGHLTRALELPSLTEAQRSRLIDLASEHRVAQAQLVEQMLAIHMGMASADSGAAPGGSREDWQQRAEGVMSMQRLRFDRDEAGRHALRSLRGILSPEQLRQIGLDG